MTANVQRFEFDLALTPVNAQFSLAAMRSLRLRFLGPPVPAPPSPPAPPTPPTETPTPWTLQIDGGMPISSDALVFALDDLASAQRAVLLVPAFGAGWRATLTATPAAARIEEA